MPSLLRHRQIVTAQQLIDLEFQYSGGKLVVVSHSSWGEPRNFCGADRMDPKRHNYAPTYAKYIAALGGTARNIAEVGILTGVGLAMWCTLFPEANVVGLDIDVGLVDKKALAAKGAFQKNTPTLVLFNQLGKNEKLLQKITPKGGFDFVVDDAAHRQEHNLACFKSFLPFLNKQHFVYIIEDVLQDNNIAEELRRLAIPNTRVEVVETVHKSPDKPKAGMLVIISK
jgi:SAM-dependent methyltransferase